MKTNKEGINIIKSYEGFSAIPYECPGGKKTIGYGHVIQPYEHFNIPILPHEAIALLKKDVAIAEEAVARLVTAPIKPNQFSALVSFVFNLGQGNFASSTLLKIVNAEKHLDVPAEFIRWIFAGGNKMRGLLLRRLDEAKLYVS